MKLLLILFPLTLTFAAFAAEPGDVRALLQQGLFEEEGNRDLDKASAAYLKLVELYDGQRNFAATALFRLAEIRAKQGDKAEAIKFYQRLLAEFPAEERLASLSRERLASFGGSVPALGQTVNALTSKEAEELVHLQEMVKNSPDLIESADSSGMSPLVKAASNGWMQAATFLIDHGAKVNGSYPLGQPLYTAESPPPSFLPGDATKLGRPLHAAARAGHKRLVELLVARGADVNAIDPIGTTALHEACARNRMEVARLLLEQGAKPNAVNRFRDNGEVQAERALFVAVRGNNAALATLLLDHGADPNLTNPESGTTPLMVAAEVAGSQELAKLLLERGADPNIAAKDGLTPLMRSCKKGQEMLVQLLLEKKAKVDVADNEGVTALHEAASVSFSLVHLLLNAGASPNSAARYLGTPLRASVRGWRARNPLYPQTQPSPESLHRFIPICEALLEKGADINAQDERGQTLLHVIFAYYLPVHSAEPAFSIIKNHIAWLIEHGGNILLKDKEGRTPCELAELEERIELERQFLFPKLARTSAIHTVKQRSSSSSNGLLTSIEPITEFDAPPELLEVVSKEIAGNNQVVPKNLSISVYRASEDGAALAFPTIEIDMSSPAFEVPALNWGDIVVIKTDDSQEVNLNNDATFWYDKALARKPVKITVQMEDRIQELAISTVPKRDITVRNGAVRQVVLTESRFYWSPIETPLPLLQLSSLVADLTAGEPRAQIDQIRLERAVNGKTREWTIDLRATDPASSEPGPAGEPGSVKQLRARFADGDRLVIPFRAINDVEALAVRRNAIFRTVSGRLFSDRIFTKSGDETVPRTLCELLVEACSHPMLVPAPDLSQITIHRLKNEGGEEEHIQVNLAQTIKSLTAAKPEEARDLDIPLQWGDIVEIPRIAGANPEIWIVFDLATQLFLDQALVRVIKVHLNNTWTDLVMRPPPLVYQFKRQRRFYEAAPSWQASLSSKSGYPIFSSSELLSRFLIEPKSILRFSIIRPGASRLDFNAAQLEAANPRLQFGDSVEIDKL